jgi:hypothetical protein
MQNIPRPEKPLDERVLEALDDDSPKTFGQIELACTTPTDLVSTGTIHSFSDRLDETLRELMADGRVILVARRPELCFRKGTILDRIVMEIERDERGAVG